MNLSKFVCIFDDHIQTYNMNYSIKFYPEKRKNIVDNVPLMLSVTYSRKRMFYYTGLRCNINDKPEKNQWNAEKNKLKPNQITPDGTTSQKFNAEITKITNAVNDLFLAYEVALASPTPEQLRDDLKKKLGKIEIVKEPEKQGFFELFDKYMKDSDLSPGRKKHLKTTYNKVKSFGPMTTFESLNVQYLTDFQNFLINYTNKKGVKIAKNTIISELRRFRAFLGYAIKHGWTTNYPFKSFSIDAEAYGDPVFITVEERDKLFSANIPNERLSRVRDLFVFQCLIGCRVGDLVKLKRSNIIDGCIEYIAGKTKDDKPKVARVPLTEKAKMIISKYDLANGDLLPYITDQKYNKYIKELFKDENVEITRIVTIADPKTRQSKQVSIATIASSHMARRVFVGSLHRKGVKNEIIASMSGHTKDSKAFSRYYNIDKEDQAQAMKLIE